MTKYKVTGGQDGLSGVEVAGKRYEPGETIEMPPKKAEWLIEIGILEVAGKASATPVEETKDEEDSDA